MLTLFACIFCAYLFSCLLSVCFGLFWFWSVPPQILASGVPGFRGKFSVDRHGGHERGFHLAYPRPGTRPGASAKVTYSSFVGPIHPIGPIDPVADIICCFKRYTIDLLCMNPGGPIHRVERINPKYSVELVVMILSSAIYLVYRLRARTVTTAKGRVIPR